MSTTDNLSQYIGEDKVYSLTIYDSSGAAQNIAGWTLQFVVTDYRDGSTIFFTIVPIIVSASAGTITVTVLAADTSGLLPTEYSYYIWRTDAGYVTITTVGLWTLKPLAVE